MEETAPVTFTLAELWVLQGAIRHGAPSAREQWPALPPVSLELNDDIADAIAGCHASGLTEYTLLLSRGDCLAIDYCVGQTAKDADGRVAGRDILLKSFHARRALLGEPPVAEEPDATDAREFLEALKCQHQS